MNNQKSIKKNSPNELQHILLIFDDFITNSELNKRRGIFTKLFSSARHYNISIIISSQSYNLIPKPIRKLTFYNIFFKLPNSELDDIIKENCAFMDEIDFLRLYKEATEIDYSFLFCMIKEKRFLQTFEKELINKEDYKKNKILL